jgi:hypothetical protein
VLNDEGRADSAIEERADVAQAARSYQTISLNRMYVGEHLSDTQPAIYVDEQQRSRFELTIRDGLLYDANGELFDTTNGQAAAAGLNAAMLVMGQDGRIFASNEYEPFVFHHSSLLAGADVAAAVMVVAREGQVTLVSDRDVRAYQVDTMATYQFLERLDSAGIPLTPEQVYLDDPDPRGRDRERFLARLPENAPVPAFLSTGEPQQDTYEGPAGTDRSTGR